MPYTHPLQVAHISQLVEVHFCKQGALMFAQTAALAFALTFCSRRGCCGCVQCLGAENPFDALQALKGLRPNFERLAPSCCEVCTWQPRCGFRNKAAALVV